MWPDSQMTVDDMMPLNQEPTPYAPELGTNTFPPSESQNLRTGSTDDQESRCNNEQSAMLTAVDNGAPGQCKVWLKAFRCLCMLHAGAHRCGEAQGAVNRGEMRQAKELRGHGGHQAPEGPVARAASCAQQTDALLSGATHSSTASPSAFHADACHAWHVSAKSCIYCTSASFSTSTHPRVAYLTKCGCHETCRHCCKCSASAHAGRHGACQHQPHRPAQCSDYDTR
jgi:hypothetical protein